jgi:hypothetical protein
VEGRSQSEQLKGAFMPISERVTSCTIAHLKNDIVDYQQVVQLTIETGRKVFIALGIRGDQSVDRLRARFA